jgi:hypothetical protein
MISEDAIVSYLTIDGQVFIAPQFEIQGETDDGRSCPDFVVLDFRRREILIVEVTDAANWQPLASRIADRTRRWFNPARRRLEQGRIVDSSWSGPRFLGFVREAAIPGLEARFLKDDDVTFCPAEQASLMWKCGEARLRDGLPDKRLASVSPALASGTAAVCATLCHVAERPVRGQRLQQGNVSSRAP